MYLENMLFNNHIYDTYQSKCFLSLTESFSLHQNITVNETSITSICTDTSKRKYDTMKLIFTGSILLTKLPEQIVSNKLLKSFFGSDKALGGFHGFGWKSININTYHENCLKLPQLKCSLIPVTVQKHSLCWNCPHFCSSLKRFDD